MNRSERVQGVILWDGRLAEKNHSSNTTHYEEVHPLRWGVLSIVVLIFATALGNLLVCLAVCRERRLQNTTNYFLMSLAIADLLVSILVMPMGMIVEIYGYFPLDPYLCVMWLTSDVLMCTASIWHMCTMSMDRYLTLKYPMRYGRNKTKTMVGIKILFVWIISIGISSPVCILGLIDSSNVFNNGFCIPTISHFVIYGSVFAFYVPLCIMIITYVLTIWILWQNQQLMKTIQRSDLRTFPSPRRRQAICTPHLLSPPSYEGSSRNVWNSQGVTDESVFASSMNTDEKVLDDPMDNAGVPANEGLMPPRNWVQHKAASYTCLQTFSLSESDYLICDAKRQQWLPKRSESTKDQKEKTVKSIADVVASTRAKQSVPANPVYLEVPCSARQSAEMACSGHEDGEDGEDAGLLPSQTHATLIRASSHNPIDHRLHQIEREMDMCLKHTIIVDENGKQMLMVSESAKHQTCTKSAFRGKNVQPKLLSDSGESDDEGDTSSNNSDLISIKLHPETLYLYRLDLTKKSLPSKLKNRKKEAETSLQNGVAGEHPCSTPENSIDLVEDAQPVSTEHHPLAKRQKSITQKMRERIKLNKASEDIKKKLIHLLPKKTATNEKKASKVLGIIFAVFVILWTPFFIMNIVSVVCESCMSTVTPEVMSTFLWMGYIASLANPIIYTMFNTSFRRAFVKILTCQCTRGRSRGMDSVMMTVAASWQSDRRNTVTLYLKEDQRR